MANGTLALALEIGAALLALWIYARFPALAPARLPRTLFHLVAAFVFLQLIPQVGGSMAPLAAVFLFVLPALVYVFLVTIWMLRHAQTALGFSR